MPQQAFICDAIRTPFGRYGGALSSLRTDDLGAIPLKALMARNAKVDWEAIDDVFFRVGAPTGASVNLSDIESDIAAISGTSGFVITSPASNIAVPVGSLPVRGTLTFV